MAFTFCGPLSQHGSARYRFCNFTRPLRQPPRHPLNPTYATAAALHARGLGYFPFRSPLLRESLKVRFLFLRLLRCFTSPGSPRYLRVTGLKPAGLPHSGISGSKAACASPKLFAACHALHRPSVPRHPPCALSTLTSLIFSIHILLSRSSSPTPIHKYNRGRVLYTGRTEATGDPHLDVRGVSP